MKILGISGYYHDSAAALVDDGKVVAASAEERLSRKKHDSGFPKNAIDFCLRRARVTVNELNWVVFYDKPFLKFERITLSHLATVPGARESFADAYKTWLRKKLWIRSEIAKHLGISTKKILFSSHHISHAASSYYTSPFSSAALLTVDGVGEWTTTAWGKAKDNKIFLNSEVKFPHSLGLFYSTFTQFLGFKINSGEFKLMGLAPYGEPRFFEKIDKLVKQSSDGSFQLDLKYFNYQYSTKTSYSSKLPDLLGVQPNTKEKSEKVIKVYADIAASVQRVLEEKLLVIAKNVRKKTGEKNLCYAGGVALNGVANWRIFKEAGFENVFIHPAAGDDGGALGAALYTYHHVLGKPRKEIFKNVFLGEENKESEIKEFIDEKKLKATKLKKEKMIDLVSEYCTKGKVVAWVQGRYEWGPRALGARSILADPRSKKMKDIVNAKIKFREAFRPFAPVALYEEASKVFELGEDYKQQPLEYMLGVVQVKDAWKDKLGATTHVNGSARPQLIKKSVNANYYGVVKAFKKKTGVPVMLNTSFNLRGQPIVNTVSQAYDTFMKSGIDALVLGNYLLEK